jgi:hypothetical protein
MASERTPQRHAANTGFVRHIDFVSYTRDISSGNGNGMVMRFASLQTELIDALPSLYMMT